MSGPLQCGSGKLKLELRTVADRCAGKTLVNIEIFEIPAGAPSHPKALMGLELL